MIDFSVIIPARLNSSRLPGKVLLDIGGKPMLQHVYERAFESGASQVIIATDDEKVAAVAEKWDAEVCMTLDSHLSGTERIAEVVAGRHFDEEDVIVCLQADEPMMPPSLISRVAKNLSEHANAKAATLAKKLTRVEELFNPNVVKVVFNYRHYAMHFSRAPIPWDRDQFQALCQLDFSKITLADAYYRHIGIYAYRAGFLETYANLAQNPIEMLESLEQLRVLWNGYKMHVGITELDIPPSVDTSADLEHIRALI